LVIAVNSFCFVAGTAGGVVESLPKESEGEMKTFNARGCVWTDTTQYSRGDEKIPTTFSTKVGEHRITVTNGHIHWRPTFIFHCFSLGLDTCPLSAQNHQDAAEQAFDRCREKVTKALRAFDELLEPAAKQSESEQAAGKQV